MQQGYVCGWDGGGTKTQVLCLSCSGAAVAEASFGPMNLNGADADTVRKTIRNAVAFMASVEGGLEACKALVIGTAGTSNAKLVGFVTDAVREAGYHGALQLLGDQEIALAGAIRGAGGVLVAGTGAICCGRGEHGETARVGGYGYLIDDEGSGYAVGRDMLTAVVRAADGRTPPTALTPLVMAQLHAATVQDIITWLYAPATDKKAVAALTPLMKEALAKQDAAAVAIADKAARELALLGITLWKRLGLAAGELALTGSILTHFDRIREQVIQLCHEAYPRMTLLAPRGTAAQGAAQLALALSRQA